MVYPESHCTARSADRDSTDAAADSQPGAESAAASAFCSITIHLVGTDTEAAHGDEFSGGGKHRLGQLFKEAIGKHF